MPTLRNLDQLLKQNLKGKTVQIRVDLNLPIKEGKILDKTRIKRFLPTVRDLIKKECKISLLSHFGRPNGRIDKKMSLKALIPDLQKSLRKEVIFSKSCIGEEPKRILEKIPNKGIVLMENTRFHRGEEKNFKKFSLELARYADFFINDAFSVSHRSHASVTGISKVLPSFAGRSLEKEITMISKFLNTKSKKRVAIIGGSKISTKISLINHMSKKVDVIVIGGAMANTFLLAKGYNIGRSLFEINMIKEAKKIMRMAKKHDCEIILPVDVAVANDFKKGKDYKLYNIDKVPNDGLILDIGKKTIRIIEKNLSNCSDVVWCGPLGLFEYRPFDIGTTSIARYISNLTNKNMITSFAGGGDTIAALRQSKCIDGLTYISTAGGAFLEMLAGKKLPGVEILKR